MAAAILGVRAQRQGLSASATNGGSQEPRVVALILEAHRCLVGGLLQRAGGGQGLRRARTPSRQGLRNPPRPPWPGTQSRTRSRGWGELRSLAGWPADMSARAVGGGPGAGGAETWGIRSKRAGRRRREKVEG
eukprot:scaffold1929_cov376-Prasinococcus_capsulatus_cf.AAC.25